MLRKLASLLRDKTWWANTAFGVLSVATSTTALFYLVKHEGLDGRFVNPAVAIVWTGGWYGVNRLALFRNQKVETSKSAKQSFRWWFVFFMFHQITFLLAITLLGWPLTIIKPFLAVCSGIEFIANYFYKKERIFKEVEVETVTA